MRQHTVSALEQRVLRLRVGGLVLASLLLALPACADEPAAAQLAAAKKRFSAAADSGAAGKEIVSILKAAKDNLAPLLADDDTSIALFAAWDAARKRDTGDNSGADWHWFVGFLQGRTGLAPPPRWEIRLAGDYFYNRPDPPEAVCEKVLEGYLKRTDVLTKDRRRTIRLKDEPEPRREAGFYAAPGLTLARQGEGDLTITVGQDKIVVPARLLREMLDKFWIDSINVLVAHDRAFVAFHERTGSAFPLYSFDLKSGNLVWRADVWAAGAENLGFISGGWHHSITLQLNKGSLLVFGDSPARYIESLDAATGKPKFRFCSNAWYPRKQ